MLTTDRNTNPSRTMNMGCTSAKGRAKKKTLPQLQSKDQKKDVQKARKQKGIFKYQRQLNRLIGN